MSQTIKNFDVGKYDRRVPFGMALMLVLTGAALYGFGSIFGLSELHIYWWIIPVIIASIGVIRGILIPFGK